MRDTKYVIIHVTPAASWAVSPNARMVIAEDGREVWIPFSNCRDGTFGADVTELEVAEWFAKKEGLV